MRAACQRRYVRQSSGGTERVSAAKPVKNAGCRTLTSVAAEAPRSARNFANVKPGASAASAAIVLLL